MRGHLECDRDVAGAEDLDRRPLDRMAPAATRICDANRATIRKQLTQPIQIHYLVLHPKGFLKPRSFGNRIWSGICPPSKFCGTM